MELKKTLIICGLNSGLFRCRQSSRRLGRDLAWATRPRPTNGTCGVGLLSNAERLRWQTRHLVRAAGGCGQSRLELLRSDSTDTL